MQQREADLLLRVHIPSHTNPKRPRENHRSIHQVYREVRKSEELRADVSHACHACAICCKTDARQSKYTEWIQSFVSDLVAQHPLTHHLISPVPRASADLKRRTSLAASPSLRYLCFGTDVTSLLDIVTTPQGACHLHHICCQARDHLLNPTGALSAIGRVFV